MSVLISFFFFFNDTATTEIYTLSLHDALPISCQPHHAGRDGDCGLARGESPGARFTASEAAIASSSLCLSWRSEEHTSELQSQSNLVCRLLLEKKKPVYR